MAASIHYSHDHYWDRNKREPRFYIEPFGAAFHETELDLSIAEQELERFITPVAEEIQCDDCAPVSRRGSICGKAVELKKEKGRVLISFDVDRCTSSQISVRTVGRSLIVEGSHDADKDQKRHRFSREFELPKVRKLQCLNCFGVHAGDSSNLEH